MAVTYKYRFVHVDDATGAKVAIDVPVLHNPTPLDGNPGETPPTHWGRPLNLTNSLCTGPGLDRLMCMQHPSGSGFLYIPNMSAASQMASRVWLPDLTVGIDYTQQFLIYDPLTESVVYSQNGMQFPTMEYYRTVAVSGNLVLLHYEHIEGVVMVQYRHVDSKPYDDWLAGEAVLTFPYFYDKPANVFCADGAALAAAIIQLGHTYVPTLRRQGYRLIQVRGNFSKTGDFLGMSIHQLADTNDTGPLQVLANKSDKYWGVTDEIVEVDVSISQGDAWRGFIQSDFGIDDTHRFGGISVGNPAGGPASAGFEGFSVPAPDGGSITQTAQGFCFSPHCGQYGCPGFGLPIAVFPACHIWAGPPFTPDDVDNAGEIGTGDPFIGQGCGQLIAGIPGGGGVGVWPGKYGVSYFQATIGSSPSNMSALPAKPPGLGAITRVQPTQYIGSNTWSLTFMNPPEDFCGNCTCGYNWSAGLGTAGNFLVSAAIDVQEAQPYAYQDCGLAPWMAGWCAWDGSTAVFVPRIDQTTLDPTSQGTCMALDTGQKKDKNGNLMPPSVVLKWKVVIKELLDATATVPTSVEVGRPTIHNGFCYFAGCTPGGAFMWFKVALVSGKYTAYPAPDSVVSLTSSDGAFDPLQLIVVGNSIFWSIGNQLMRLD